MRKLKERERYDRLLELLRKAQRLEYAANLLHWDLETYIPPGGVDGRARVIATVSTAAFEILTSDELGELLEELNAPESLEKLSDLERAIVKVTYRDYRRKKAIPPKLYHKFQEESAKAQVAWRKAREEANFSTFKPHLDELLKLSREMADHIGYDIERYDALLEEYEPGFRASTFAELIPQLRDGLIRVIEKLKEGTEPSQDILRGEFSEELQRRLLEKALSYMGLDFTKTRIDKSAHPFTITIGPNDVRITVRYTRRSFIESLMAGMHEGGHALYELGVHPELLETPLGTGASYGMHESQSRFWENIIGRSKAFWRFIWADMKQIFGGLLKGGPDDYFKAVNVVKPSLIRVEADEVTYNLHIILRFELERKMINEDDFDTSLLPEMWNQKMREYLGLTPPDDSKGVLQDIHWSFGAFGYFPTYTLGNLYATQLYSALKSEEPALFEGELSTTKLSEILRWLREKVHIHGRSKQPTEIMKEVTGKALNPLHFLRYIAEKYSEVYEVDLSTVLEPITNASS